jgi:hypothetical protein
MVTSAIKGAKKTWRTRTSLLYIRKATSSGKRSKTDCVNTFTFL